MKVLFFRETSASNSSDDHRIVMLKSKGQHLHVTTVQVAV